MGQCWVGHIEVGSVMMCPMMYPIQKYSQNMNLLLQNRRAILPYTGNKVWISHRLVMWPDRPGISELRWNRLKLFSTAFFTDPDYSAVIIFPLKDNLYATPRYFHGIYLNW